MDTFAELIAGVQSDLTIDSNSTLFPPATVKLALNRANRKSGALFRWPETDDAKKTSTEPNAEYYEYPQTWRPDSIWMVTVDGVMYGETPDGSPMNFRDFLKWKLDNPNSTLKKWANQWRRYFVNPIPTVQGDNNICVWGQRVVDALVDLTDVTIFSYSMPECNEAVVMEAVAILKAKSEEIKVGEFLSTEAKGILAKSWSTIRQEQSKYEKNLPMFEVPDFYRGARGMKVSDIGNFSD